MELRRYWQIILRYWWVILLLTLIGVIAAYQYYTSNRPLYTNTITVNISRDPSPSDQYSEYYANIASEYAADDFTQVLKGNIFLEDVSNLLKTRGYDITAEGLKGLIDVKKEHRELYVTAASVDKGISLAVNRAVGDTLVSNAGTYIKNRKDAQPIRANLIDVPKDAPLSGGRTALLAAIRPVIGLVIGLVLAFLLAYLDNSLRTEAEVKEVLGLPVLASIPKPTAKNRSSHEMEPGAGFKAEAAGVERERLTRR